MSDRWEWLRPKIDGANRRCVFGSGRSGVTASPGRQRLSPAAVAHLGC